MGTRINSALPILMAAMLAGCTNYEPLPTFSSAPANSEYTTLYNCPNPDHFEEDSKFSIVSRYHKYQFVKWESPSSTYDLSVVFNYADSGGARGKVFESPDTQELLKVQERPGSTILEIRRNPPEQMTCYPAR